MYYINEEKDLVEKRRKQLRNKTAQKKQVR